MKQEFVPGAEALDVHAKQHRNNNHNKRGVEKMKRIKIILQPCNMGKYT